MKPNRLIYKANMGPAPKAESMQIPPETKNASAEKLVELEARHRLEREKILQGAVAARNIIIEQTAEDLNTESPVSRQDIEPNLLG